MDLLTRTLGKAATRHVYVKIEGLEGQEIACVRVGPSPITVYLNPAKGEKVDEVYVRFGNSTRKLTPKEVAEFRDQGAWVTSSAPTNTAPNSLQIDQEHAEVEPL